MSYQNMIFEESRFKLKNIGVTRINLDDSYIEIPTFYDVINKRGFDYNIDEILKEFFITSVGPLNPSELS